MAHPQILVCIFSIFLFCLSCLHLSINLGLFRRHKLIKPAEDVHRLLISNSLPTDVHHLLISNSLPPGLIPNNVESSDEFNVKLKQPCEVQFGDQLVHYDKQINVTIGYNSLNNVSGISVKKHRTWLPVTRIQTDFYSQVVEFHVGDSMEKFKWNDFFNIPSCRAWWNLHYFYFE